LQSPERGRARRRARHAVVFELNITSAQRPQACVGLATQQENSCARFASGRRAWRCIDFLELPEFVWQNRARFYAGSRKIFSPGRSPATLPVDFAFAARAPYQWRRRDGGCRQ